VFSLSHIGRDPVLIILLIASVASWIIILDRWIVFARGLRADQGFQRDAVSSPSPLAGFAQLLARHPRASREHLITQLNALLLRQRQRLEGKLPLLGVIGSTAPYVGLLGTVIGIIQAFHAITLANNMSPSVVANGIATALIATAAGLGVAIPAVAAHHLLMAAISRRVAAWEEVVATWLPDPDGAEECDESLTASAR